MDFISLITGTVILMLFIIPFAIAHLKNNSEKTFEKFCADNNFEIYKKESFNNLIIAIDRKNKKLIRAEVKGKSLNSILIDIDKMGKCDIKGNETSGISINIDGNNLRLTSSDDGIQTNIEALHIAKTLKRELEGLS